MPLNRVLKMANFMLDIFQLQYKRKEGRKTSGLLG